MGLLSKQAGSLQDQRETCTLFRKAPPPMPPCPGSATVSSPTLCSLSCGDVDAVPRGQPPRLHPDAWASLGALAQTHRLRVTLPAVTRELAGTALRARMPPSSVLRSHQGRCQWKTTQNRRTASGCVTGPFRGKGRLPKDLLEEGPW